LILKKKLQLESSKTSTLHEGTATSRGSGKDKNNNKTTDDQNADVVGSMGSDKSDRFDPEVQTELPNQKSTDDINLELQAQKRIQLQDTNSNPIHQTMGMLFSLYISQIQNFIYTHIHTYIYIHTHY